MLISKFKKSDSPIQRSNGFLNFPFISRESANPSPFFGKSGNQIFGKSGKRTRENGFLKIKFHFQNGNSDLREGNREIKRGEKYPLSEHKSHKVKQEI